MGVVGLPNFAHPDADTQTWYVATRSANVRPGRIASYPLLHRQIAVYRDRAGAVHALDARCPHLGADLGQGALVDDAVECAFHHWRFTPDGHCCFAPGCSTTPDRRVRVYPTEERWGLVWFFNGPHPLFPLPSLPDPGSYRIVLPRTRHIRCHPHLVVGNGLDVRHLETLHGMTFTAPPQWSITGPYEITVTVQGRPRSVWLQWFTHSLRDDIVATFSTFGGNLAWATVAKPVRFHTLFTGQPDLNGGCRTQIVLFLPATWDVRPLQALALMFTLLHNDRRILEHLHFAPAYSEGDEPLRALAELVNRMPTW